MLYLLMGLCWVSLAVVLFAARESLKDHNPTWMIAFACLLATYNFVRCGVNWLARRSQIEENDDILVPKCPRCGRPMHLENGADASTARIVCCGYELHVKDEQERLSIIRLIKDRFR